MGKTRNGKPAQGGTAEPWLDTEIFIVCDHAREMAAAMPGAWDDVLYHRDRLVAALDPGKTTTDPVKYRPFPKSFLPKAAEKALRSVWAAAHNLTPDNRSELQRSIGDFFKLVDATVYAMSPDHEPVDRELARKDVAQIEIKPAATIGEIAEIAAALSGAVSTDIPRHVLARSAEAAEGFKTIRTYCDDAVVSMATLRKLVQSVATERGEDFDQVWLMPSGEFATLLRNTIHEPGNSPNGSKAGKSKYAKVLRFVEEYKGDNDGATDDDALAAWRKKHPIKHGDVTVKNIRRARADAKRRGVSNVT